MMPCGFYAADIDHLHLSPDEYDEFIRSPYADESIVGGSSNAVVVVEGAERDLALPGSLPVVVVWVGSEFGGDGPEQADVVVAGSDVDGLLNKIRKTPLAACSLAVLLRGLESTNVETGLAMESSVYSMLQAGPEFTAWRAATTATPDDQDNPTVLVDRAGDELTVTLDRPHRHNAVSTRLRDELAAALAIAIVDTSITSVILRGNGPSFCSGGDLDEFGSRPDATTAHVTRLARSPARLIHELRDRITIDIHGATLGGGIEIAAFGAHVRAHLDTQIALPEVALGLIPGAGGTVSLTRRVGRQRTALLALTGVEIGAETALGWGLVDKIVD